MITKSLKPSIKLQPGSWLSHHKGQLGSENMFAQGSWTHTSHQLRPLRFDSCPKIQLSDLLCASS